MDTCCSARFSDLARKSRMGFMSPRLVGTKFWPLVAFLPQKFQDEQAEYGFCTRHHIGEGVVQRRKLNRVNSSTHVTAELGKGECGCFMEQLSVNEYS